MKAKTWTITWLICGVSLLALCCAITYYVDPFFHYHTPHTDKYFYELNNERSQNNGISKHFDFDSVITGTSMTENFKTSEFDKIFGFQSVKMSMWGASYHEISRNLRVALNRNPNIKCIVRSFDRDYFFDDAHLIRYELGEHPEYLYDSNPFNDVKYLLNKDILVKRAVPMILNLDKRDPGITSFDDYASWQHAYTFGRGTVCKQEFSVSQPSTINHLTEEEKSRIKEDVELNFIDLAREYPQTQFICFFTPYSAVWWGNKLSAGELDHYIEAEDYVISLLEPYKNIQLFSFDGNGEITTNLNFYGDYSHYGKWVNSQILKWMKSGYGRITPENRGSHIRDLRNLYTSFDYASLNSQYDYEDDAAEALLQAIVNDNPALQ